MSAELAAKVAVLEDQLVETLQMLVQTLELITKQQDCIDHLERVTGIAASHPRTTNG